MTRAARGDHRPSWGAVIREARRAAALTQADLAHRSGVSLGAVRDLEQGRTLAPRSASMDAVRSVLGLDAPAAPRPVVDVRLGVLGPLHLDIGGRDATPRGRLQATMLALAAVHVGEWVGDDRYAEMLWPHGRPRDVPAALHTHAARLRTLLTGGTPAADGSRPVLVRERGGYRLLAPAGAVDTQVFTDRVAQASRTTDRAERVPLLLAALQQWRGPVASDLPELVGDPQLAGWERRRRDAAADLAHDALDADADLAGGAAAAVGEVLRLHTLDEDLAVRLMLLLVHLGRPADALRVFDRVRRALSEELGNGPGPPLREAHRIALRVDGDGHDAPRGRAAHSELLRDLPDFVGHEDETAEAEREVLRTDGVPGIVAIAGMAGIGKTTLATRAAHRVRDRFPDGQFHLDLRGVDDRPLSPAHAVDLLLRRLDVVSSPADDASARAGQLRSALAQGRYLIVLDNVRDAGQVRDLLPGSAGSATLITSRRSLVGLDGACRIEMRTLPDAVAKDFIRHRVVAGRTPVDERAVAGIAEACGRLPLALRLAVDHATAAHTDLPTLHASLADSSARWRVLRQGDRAVRATLELGWAGLDADLRRTLGDLAGLPGGEVHLEAALAAAGLTEAEQLITLSELSLLEIRDDRRVGMHDLVRAMVRELEPRPTDATSTPAGRAVAWYADTALAMTAARHTFRPMPSPISRRGSVTHAEATAWLARAHGTLLAFADAMLSGNAPFDWRLLFSTAYSCEDREESTRAVELLEAAMTRIGPSDVEAVVYLNLVVGRAHARSYRHHEALGPLEYGRALAHEHGLSALEVWAHELTAVVHDMASEPALAERHYAIALDLVERAALPQFRWSILNNYGKLQMSHGRIDDAVRLFEQALQGNEERGYRKEQLVNRGNLGTAAWLQGDHARAVEVLAPITDSLLEIGEVRAACESLLVQSRAAVSLDQRDLAEASSPRALDLAVRLDDGALFARALAAVAVVEARWHDVDRGADGLAHALAVTRAVRAPAFEVEVLLAHGVVTLIDARPALVAQAADDAERVARAIGHDVAAVQADELRTAARAVPVPAP